jgi:hypothetical protein
MRFTHVAMTVLVCGAAGCASQQPPAVDTTGRMLDAQFSESAQKIDSMMVDVARAGGVSAVAPRTGKVMVSGDLITVQWQGDAPEVLRKLAEAKGLRFAAMGRAVPIPVSLSAIDTRFVDVLENVGTQCGGRADVVLTNDALEIHYRGV